MNKEKLFNKAVFYLKIYNNKFTAWANCCVKCKYEIANSGDCKRERLYIEYNQITKTYMLTEGKACRPLRQGGGMGRCILWLDK